MEVTIQGHVNMKRDVRVAVLYGVGLNCDYETQHAFRLAGANAERVHVNRLIEDPQVLEEYDVLGIPGGFSYGDDLAAGRVLATKMKRGMGEEIGEFIDDGKPVIGICNGFQVLVSGGFLPDLDGNGEQEVTLTYNDSGRFEDRWVYLNANPRTECPFMEGVDLLELPVRHGEGKFVADGDVLERVVGNDLVVLRYVDKDGGWPPPYPLNPNGSIGDIAAITNKKGNVLGMMPHPEGFIFREQHPRWTCEELPEEGSGLQIFRNIVDYVRENL